MAKKTNGKNELFGGLRAENIDKIDSKFICVVCKSILLYPYQLLCCGYLLCEWCLKNALPDSEPFICPLCHVEQVKKQASIDRGAQRELNKIIIVCYSCTWNGFYSDYLNHLQKCHADLECNDCHERFFSINSFEQHRQELCEHRSLPCGLPNCGNSIKWYNMKTHYLSYQHQYTLNIIVFKYIRPAHREAQDRERLEITRKEHKDIQEILQIAFAAYKNLSNEPVRVQSEINQMQINYEQNGTRTVELRKQSNDNEKYVQELTEKHNNIQIQLENCKKITDEDEIQILDNDSTVTLRFDKPTTSSFSINSSKFKTSQHGHTFMLRVCSTIYGKEEYLSLFLSLYSGDYDNLIPFPYSYDIYLALWDQSNQQKHIKCAVKPDLTSSAFARPTSEKNDEYEIFKFCSLHNLTDPNSIYVKDGVFFIRAFIDFLNTGLNPFEVNSNNPNIETISTTMMITD